MLYFIDQILLNFIYFSLLLWISSFFVLFPILNTYFLTFPPYKCILTIKFPQSIAFAKSHWFSYAVFLFITHIYVCYYIINVDYP